MVKWEEMIKKIRGSFLQNLACIWGITLTFLIGGIWFFQNGYIVMTDLTHGPGREYAFNSSTILMNIILYLGDFISYEFSSKFIYIFTFLLLYFAGVHLAKNFTENKYLQSFIGTFSVMNLFVYERTLYGQVGVTLACGFLILFFSYLCKIYFTETKIETYLKKENRGVEEQEKKGKEIKQERNLASPNFAQKVFFQNILLAGIFAGLAIDSSIHVVFFIIFILVIFFIAEISKIYKNNLFNFKVFLKLSLENVYIFLISLLVNIGFIINTFLGKNQILDFTNSKISNLDLNAFQTVGNNIFEKLFNVLLLTGFWGREQKRFLDITDNPLWFIAFLPFIFLFIFALYKLYLNNKKLFFICISFILLIPILAVATSISHLDFLYKYIPFYNGLREPQKWTMLLIPVYSILIIFGIKNIKNISQNILISFFFLILFLFQNKFLFGFWGQMKSVEYPESWYKVNQIIENNNLEKFGQKCKRENLFLPWHLYLSFPFTQNVIANPANSFFTCKTIVGTNMEFGGVFDNNLNDASNKYGFWIFENNKNAPPESLEYIIVAKSVDWERYNWLKENSFVENIFEDENMILYKVKN
jgi:hypothetical protein